MSYLAGFHAKTLASPGKAQASPEPGPGCGPTWPASLARFDRDSCSWKTAQLCLLGDSESSSVTWPRSGMTAGGQCWELPMSGRRTSGTDSGLLPTPLASNTKAVHMRSNGRPAMSYLGPICPTPTVCGNYNRKGASPTSGDGLATAVKKWPTPIAHAGSNRRTKPTPAQEAGKAGMQLAGMVGGSLNPTWVEWLMGWPLGWTDLKPLAMGKSHCALPQRGDC